MPNLRNSEEEVVDESKDNKISKDRDTLAKDLVSKYKDKGDKYKTNNIPIIL